RGLLMSQVGDQHLPNRTRSDRNRGQCVIRCRPLSTTDPLCFNRSPSSAIFSRVPSPVHPAAAEVPVAIAPNPTTPDTALIFSSHRRLMGTQSHTIYPL